MLAGYCKSTKLINGGLTTLDKCTLVYDKLLKKVCYKTAAESFSGDV